MLARAFGSQLDEHAREDIYSTAWSASLSSLGGRIDGMSNAELHNYVFSAVSTHAGKELRRRGRKPVDSLEGIEPSGGSDGGPADLVVRREDQQVLRDVMASLPERRRQVITLRYAVGLTPQEICEVVTGLSLRAYRKEIQRGVKDLADRLSLVERGEWCARLESEIRSFARGQANAAGQEQARAHLAHCAGCSRAVRELARSLNDLSLLPVAGILAGSSATGTGVIDGASGLVDRAKGAVGSVVARAGDAEAVAGSLASSGGTRGGATALLAGLGTKIGALGVAGKVALGCVGATAGLATCVATGVVPASAVDGLLPEKPSADRAVESQIGAPEPAPELESVVNIGDGDKGDTTSPAPEPDADAASGSESAKESADPGPVIAPQSVTPIERESSPEVAAATSTSAGGASGGGSREAPKTADAGDASAQLGTP